MLFSYYAASVAFLIPFYGFGATPNESGLFVDMWTVGLMIFILSVWFTHFIFLFFIRDFNIGMMIALVIIYLQWLLIVGIVNKGIVTDPLWQGVFEALQSIHFWSVFFVTLVLMLLPIFVYRQASALIVFSRFNFA